jgi:Concanavalin A-like lectin/glucanases superfamily
VKKRLIPSSAALFLAAATVAAFPVLQAPAASAAPMSGSGPGQNLSAITSSSWQTNNTVWEIAPVNGNVFVGGSFTSVRPPGDALGTGEVARTYLAEFDASTGALETAFDPTLDGMVTAMALSPDGSTLYIGGSFTHVGTAFRNHLAAFNTATGALSTTWVPNSGSPVLALAVSPDGSNVYVGGSMGKLDSVARTDAGEVTASTGAIEPWAPNLNGTVTTIAVAADNSRVLVGGYFSQFNGAPQQAVIDTDATTGAANILHSIEPNQSGCTSTVKDIVVGSVTAQNPAGIAYIASEGTGGGCFDGTWAANIATGALIWQSDCLGATQALVIINNWLYKGSHAHDCAFSAGGFPQVSTVNHHLLSQSLTDGTIGHWNPDTNMGNSDTGAVNGGLGPRVFATDGTNMFMGGDFTTVNSVGQQGFAIFRPGPDSAPNKPAKPTAVSTQAGTDTVTFTGASDLDDGTLTYAIYRSGTTASIGSITATSWPWALPVLHFQDTGLTPGKSYTYTVTASDGTLTSAKSPASAAVVVASANPALSYQQSVLNDSPSFLWPLNDSGGTAADASGNGFNGIYEPGTTQGVAGPFSGSQGTSFDGQSGLVTSANQVAGPNNFTIEGWFKTTTNQGGKLIGFGNNQTGSSGNYDRHVYMMNDGQLVFGLWNNATETIESPDVYNDGQWHYIVATLDPTAGMTLYIDGQLVGTNANTVAQPYSGYWRLGGDNLNGWNLDPWGASSNGVTEPVSYYFNGSMADFAVYPYALSATQIAAHYAAGVFQQ